jgi:hypothetical protein
MGTTEHDLLEELKAYLKKPFDKQCVDSYLRKPLTSSITEAALAKLRQASDEAAET